MGDRKGHGLCDRRMLQQDFVNFVRGDFLPTAIDHFPSAAGKKQVPVVIEETKIACLEPIARKGRLGRHCIAIVARHDAGAPDDDLAGLAAGQQNPSLVHDRDVQIHRDAGRTGLALARRQRIARDERRSGFRHPVGFDHGRLERPLDLLEHAEWQRSRCRAHEAQPKVRQSLATAPGVGENCLMHGGDRGVPRRSKFGQPCKEAVHVASSGTYDARASRKRGQHHVRQTMPMKQWQHVYASIGLAERHRRDRAASRRADIGMRQRDDLRP